MIPVTTFAGRMVAVFGLARSGIAAAEALRAGGADVACWDDGEAGRAAAAKAGLALVDLHSADWTQFAVLVLSPGVPLTHPAPHWTVQRAKAAGVAIIGDIELFFRERAKTAPAAPVIAITGTNGKSTTTALITHILRQAGRDAQMGGNIGVGVLALEPFAAGRVHVLEMSSFQIDLTPTLNPTVGILLNITPDHLDRHGTLADYADVKTRLIAGCDSAVIGCDDVWCRAAADDWVEAGKPVVRISVETVADVFYRDGGIFCRGLACAPARAVADLGGIGSLRGAHNGQNAAAAYAAVVALGIAPPTIAAAFATFPGLAHRMEELGHAGKVLVVNDSKATNADSTGKALAAFPGDIFWIVGGTPKEGGIAPLAPYFSRIAKAYLVGMSVPDFAATLLDTVAFESCGTLDVALAAAVRDATASKTARPVVLLSPACASYDQYRSFEHRGDHFRALARALPGFVANPAAAP